MAGLVGISGSLRRDSFNTALLRSAALVAPEGTTLEVHALHGIPRFNGADEVASGVPA